MDQRRTAEEGITASRNQSDAKETTLNPVPMPEKGVSWDLGQLAGPEEAAEHRQPVKDEAGADRDRRPQRKTTVKGKGESEKSRIDRRQRIRYDLHVHTCLSPCGDNEMTPSNIVRLAELIGCEMLAITDHNSCGNVAGVMEAAKGTDLLVIPGMELCVSEEAHVICLFETLEGALAFGDYVSQRMPPIKNRPEIFGEQRICDGQDRVIGLEEGYLLSSADISVSEVIGLTRVYGGAVFPAHVNRDSYSVIASLGDLPKEADFSVLELSSDCHPADFFRLHPGLREMRRLQNSDAHYLEVFAGEKQEIILPERSAKALIQWISGDL